MTARRYRRDPQKCMLEKCSRVAKDTAITAAARADQGHIARLV
jgi:hypothetical protein